MCGGVRTDFVGVLVSIRPCSHHSKNDCDLLAGQRRTERSKSLARSLRFVPIGTRFRSAHLRPPDDSNFQIAHFNRLVWRSLRVTFSRPFCRCASNRRTSVTEYSFRCPMSRNFARPATSMYRSARVVMPKSRATSHCLRQHSHSAGSPEVEVSIFIHSGSRMKIRPRSCGGMRMN